MCRKSAYALTEQLPDRLNLSKFPEIYIHLCLCNTWSFVSLPIKSRPWTFKTFSSWKVTWFLKICNCFFVITMVMGQFINTRSWVVVVLRLPSLMLLLVLRIWFCFVSFLLLGFNFLPFSNVGTLWSRNSWFLHERHKSHKRGKFHFKHLPCLLPPSLSSWRQHPVLWVILNRIGGQCKNTPERVTRCETMNLFRSAARLCWSHSAASHCSMEITIWNHRGIHAICYPACNCWKYCSVLWSWAFPKGDVEN